MCVCVFCCLGSLVFVSLPPSPFPVARPLPEAAFGLGDGLIILNNPNCQGDEDGLIECPGSFFSDNTHADDVGVVCFDTIGKQQLWHIAADVVVCWSGEECYSD